MCGIEILKTHSEIGGNKSDVKPAKAYIFLLRILFY